MRHVAGSRDDERGAASADGVVRGVSKTVHPRFAGNRDGLAVVSYVGVDAVRLYALFETVSTGLAG